jgi:hypothetical protein
MPIAELAHQLGYKGFACCRFTRPRSVDAIDHSTAA